MKTRTQYSCQSCGHMSPQWLGRCPSCEAWNTLIEEKSEPEQDARRSVALEMAEIHGALVTGSGQDWVTLERSEDEESSQLSAQHLQRFDSGVGELNRVLGGGMVPDGFVLLGGDPGIGKSTLLLQMAKGLREKNAGTRILYVSGEESIDQIRGRAHRLGVEGKGQIFLAAETVLERVFATIKELKPHVLIMDSLQTFSSGSLDSAPGSVSQVREVAMRLMSLAKSARIAVWLVGHVTKEGNIAGPKAVEHMVDTVLYFEAEAGQTYRLLRTVKNRFGSTRELGVFEMDGDGLREVANPSSLFLSERKEAVSGTAVCASLEGSRTILVELQGLVTHSGLSMPRRTAVGMDSSRLSLLAAILEKHMRLQLAERDLFFNVAGGLKLTEPACDLGAAAAIWSSYVEKPIRADWVFLGELGLTGEVRRVPSPEVRVQEAAKLGFKVAILPRASIERVKNKSQIRLIPIEKISELPQIFA